MKENTLIEAKQDIDEALNAITEIEKGLADKSVHKELIKENFEVLIKKMNKIEDILKEEGIL